MASKISTIAQTFLNEMSKKTDSIYLLNSMLKILEEQEDPSSREIKLASDIYQFLEKMSLLKENLRTYTVEKYEENNPGTTLDNLLKDQGKFFID